MEYVYIIKEIQNSNCVIKDGKSNYKIGFSYDTSERIKGLQTANPNKLELVEKYDCKNCRVLEKRIHNHLKDKQLNGEWFCLSPLELSNCIDIILKLINEIHEKIKKNTCEICDFCSYKNENFNKHLKSKAHNRALNKKKSNTYTCPYCENNYTTASNLARHKRTCSEKEDIEGKYTIELEKKESEITHLKEIICMLKNQNKFLWTNIQIH